jgi:pimeloyl-ACP methyl ester carboxylesterase
MWIILIPSALAAAVPFFLPWRYVLLLFAALVLAHHWASQPVYMPSTHPQPSDTVVVISPGFLSFGFLLRPVAWYILSHTHHSVLLHSLSLQDQFAPLSKQADLLAADIQALVPSFDTKRLAFVGTSLGGLRQLVAVYRHPEQIESKTHRVVSIGRPEKETFRFRLYEEMLRPWFDEQMGEIEAAMRIKKVGEVRYGTRLDDRCPPGPSTSRVYSMEDAWWVPAALHHSWQVYHVHMLRHLCQELDPSFG